MAEALLVAAGRRVSVVLVEQAALSSRDPRLLAWAAGHDGIPRSPGRALAFVVEHAGCKDDVKAA